MKNGFSLLEVIIAVSILGTGIAGAIALTTQTISAGVFVRNQLIAAHLAQEGLEVIHNIRHTNWVEEAEDGVTKWFAGLDKANCTPEPLTSSDCPIYAIVNYNSTALSETSNPVDWQMSFDSISSRYIHDMSAPIYLRHIEISYAQDSNSKEYMLVKSIVSWDKGAITAEDTLYNWKEAPQ